MRVKLASLAASHVRTPIRALVRAQTFREYGALRSLRHKMVARRFYGDARGFGNSEYAAIWREAAQELGTEVVDRGQGFLEIVGEQRSTWVWRQYTALDDLIAFRR